MLGVLHEHRLEHRGGLQVGRVGLVGLRLGRRGVQRREDLRLVVGGVARGECVEGLRPRRLPGPLGLAREISVVRGDGLDVVLLALRSHLHAAALIDRGLRGRRRLRRSALPGERVVHQEGGDAERGDAAARVVLDDLAEGLLAFREPERMQHRHRPLQVALHLGIARVGEGDLAELAVLFVHVLRDSAAGERTGNGSRGR